MTSQHGRNGIEKEADNGGVGTGQTSTAEGDLGIDKIMHSTAEDSLSLSEML